MEDTIDVSAGGVFGTPPFSSKEDSGVGVRVPSSIKIGPVWYRVEESADLTDAADCWGWINYAKQTITLKPGMESDHQAITLLHEVLHAIWLYGNLSGFEGDAEQTISALAPALLNTLRENWDFVKFLVGVDI